MEEKREGRGRRQHRRDVSTISHSKKKKRKRVKLSASILKKENQNKKVVIKKITSGSKVQSLSSFLRQRAAQSRMH